MSTPAIIALHEPGADTVTAIYVHWDGYPSHTGKILAEHYNSLEAAKALVNLGDLSSIEPKLKPEPGQKHTFDEPADGVCVAYCRDRGETFHAETLFYSSNPSTMIQRLSRMGGCYAYLFDGGRWHRARSGVRNWIPISDPS